jgi:VCBS repeat-containing protein
VAAVNDPPVANSDVVTTNEDTPVVVAVLTNDTDLDGDLLEVTAASATSGVVTINPDGTLVYTPNANFNGVDTITYTISDGHGGTATATATITVNPVNDPPVAADDTATTNEDTPLTIPVLANDGDLDGDPLTVVSASAGHGSVTINPDGTLSYTPAANFNGVDTISYTISDGAGGTSTATVTVSVNPVNDPPVAANDTATTPEDTPVTIPVLANDSDLDGDPLTVTSASAGHGSVTINADGTIVYTPNVDFNGVDTITYAVSDGYGGTTTATVTVTVLAVNDPPVAANDRVSTSEDTPVVIPVLANDGDLDGDPLSVVSANAANGRVTINPDGTIVYTPNANFNGVDTITYAISDGAGGFSTATVTVTVAAVNDAPVANPDVATTNEDTPVTIPVLANDSDADGDPLTVTAASAGHGTVTINPDGTVSYTPDGNFNGADTITYTISDGQGGVSTATVAITVNAVNDPPVANPDVATTSEDTPLVVTVLGNDSDLDGNPLTVTSANAANGIVTINPDGTLTYTPTANFNGSDTITYTISDGAGGTATATVTVTVNAVNDLPTDGPETVNVIDGNPVTVNVLANAGDPDGDPLTVASAVASSGVVTINPDGTLTYTPDPTFDGVATITYVVSDGKGGLVTSTVTVNVTAHASADVNQLLEIATPNIPDAFRPAAPRPAEAPFITGPPIIIDAVNGISSLNGGADLIAAQGPVVAATNGLGDLNGLGAFEVDGHPVSQEVARIEQHGDFRFGADRLFDRRFGDVGVEGLTGFSVQAQRQGQVLVESVVRDSAIFVDIRDTGGGSPIVQYQIRMRDGGPVPAWIQFDARGLAIIEPPAGADTVRLIIRSVREDGSVLETPVIIQSATGEIQIDTLAGEARQVGQAPTLDQAIALAEASVMNEAARLAAAFGG